MNGIICTERVIPLSIAKYFLTPSNSWLSTSGRFNSY